jgi:hypothetical protein
MAALGLIPALAAILVLIPAVPGLGPAQADEILAPQDCGSIGMVRLLQFGGADDPGDLTTCQQNCRSRYGVDPYSDSDTEPQYRGRGSSGSYWLYARCIQDCNEAFWKDFDWKFGDSDKTQ